MLSHSHACLRLALPLASLFGVASAGAPARIPIRVQDDAVVRLYDVRALLSAESTRPPLVDLRPPASASRINYLQPDQYDIDLGEPFSFADEGLGDILQELVEQLPDVGEYDVDERGGVVRVLGSERVQADVQRLLADLASLAFDEVEVELHRVACAAAGEQGQSVFTAEQADTALPISAATLVARRAVPMGTSTALSTAGAESTLIDYDVEVAQGALAIDPQVTALPTGLAFAVNVRVGVNGRLLVRAWAREATPARPLREFVIPGFGGAALQLPDLQMRVATASATLDDGGALLFGGGDGADAYLLRVQRKRPATAPGTAGSPFIACGDTVVTGARTKPIRPARAAPSGGWSVDEVPLPEWLDDSDALMSPEEVFDGFSDTSGARGLSGRMSRIGAFIYVPEEGALRAAARAHVASIGAGLVAETFEVEARYGEVDPGQLAELLYGKLDERARGALIQGLAGRVATAVRGGDTSIVMDGREWFYLQDYDVEIAQASTVPDPIPATCFDGVSFWCVPLRAPDGLVSTAVDLVFQRSARSSEPFPTADWDPVPTTKLDELPQPIGDFVVRNTVELAVTRGVSARRTVRAKDGEWALVTVEPTTEGRSFIAWVRVTGRR
ncbi:MAG: hypothetical protein R3F49_21205 [Planctomycetota bacterium]